MCLIFLALKGMKIGRDLVKLMSCDCVQKASVVKHGRCFKKSDQVVSLLERASHLSAGVHWGQQRRCDFSTELAVGEHRGLRTVCNGIQSILRSSGGVTPFFGILFQGASARSRHIALQMCPTVGSNMKVVCRPLTISRWNIEVFQAGFLIIRSKGPRYERRIF